MLAHKPRLSENRIIKISTKDAIAKVKYKNKERRFLLPPTRLRFISVFFFSPCLWAHELKTQTLTTKFIKIEKKTNLQLIEPGLEQYQWKFREPWPCPDEYPTALLSHSSLQYLDRTKLVVGHHFRSWSRSWTRWWKKRWWSSSWLSRSFPPEIYFLSFWLCSWCVHSSHLLACPSCTALDESFSLLP